MLAANSVNDHIAVVKAALAQCPDTSLKPGRAARSLSAPTRRRDARVPELASLPAVVVFGRVQPARQTLARIPSNGWTPAYDGDGQLREGARVADGTGPLDLKSWPSRMRVIVRKERPHPGAQLLITDADGRRVTAFATNTTRGQLADLELRHCRRARCEDRIRVAKDARLSNLPLHEFTENRCGARASRSPSNLPPGCGCWPWPGATRAAGNPNA
jgi:Transposase DDE domain group 1